MSRVDSVVGIITAVVAVVAAVAVVALYGWLIMLSVGIVHSIFGWPSGTISFVEGCTLLLPVMVFFGSTSSLSAKARKSS